MQYATNVYLRVEVSSKVVNLGNKLKCSTSSRSGRLTQVEIKEFRKVLNSLESTDKSTNNSASKCTDHHSDNHFKKFCFGRSIV